MRAVLAILLVCACDAPPRPSAETVCRLDAAPDPARALRLEAMLRDGSAEGRALVEGSLAQVQAICFGPSPLSVITSEHVIVIDTRLGDAEAAARLGHLLVHERDGHPMDEEVGAATNCDAVLRRALEREARAYAAEARLRRALGVVHPVMAFEIAEETALLGPAQAETRWLMYLETHPDGAPGIDALARAYRAQCERARAAAGDSTH